MARNAILYAGLTVMLFLFGILDIVLGSVYIPIDEILNCLLGKSDNTSWVYIIEEFRMPKALTAMLVGAGISVTGLHMQTMFRNPLADTSILGIGHGASLGVALFVLAAGLFPGIIPDFIQHSSWGIILAAVAGAAAVLAFISGFAVMLNNLIALLLVGVMVSFVTGALVSVLQFFSDPELIKDYLVWTFGSLAGVTWTQLKILAPIILVSLFASLLLPKSMNAFLLGENYAKSVGVRVGRVRFALIAITSVLAGSITAFTGPIAFMGIAVPHFTRILFRTSDHKVLIPATMLCGAALMLVCDIISQMPGGHTALPINSVTSLIGAPVVIAVVVKNIKQKRNTF